MVQQERYDNVWYLIIDCVNVPPLVRLTRKFDTRLRLTELSQESWKPVGERLEDKRPLLLITHFIDYRIQYPRSFCKRLYTTKCRHGNFRSDSLDIFIFSLMRVGIFEDYYGTKSEVKKGSKIPFLKVLRLSY